MLVLLDVRRCFLRVCLFCFQAYMIIFPPLLNPMFWERPGNIPALTRLLVAYLTKAGQEIVAGGEAGRKPWGSANFCASFCASFCATHAHLQPVTVQHA
jgi:hypothetical protein